MLSENASIKGKPAAVFTENKEPDKESSTENNLPEVPSTVKTPEPEPCNPKAEVDPETCSFAEVGVIVPIPILPLELTNKKLVEPEVTWKEAVPGETDAETDPVAI